MTRILGVDPSTTAFGWGIIESDGHENHLLEFGVIHTAPKQSLHLRLQTIYYELKGVIDQFRPDVIAVEEVFVGKNPRSALWIGYARAIALLAAAQHKLELAEYSAREVKLSVVGNGSASKDQVEYMVGTILHIENTIPHDAADALAVALCHASRLYNNPGTSDR